MAKRDFKKELKHLYGPSKKEFSVVDVPPMNFIMIDGRGDPNSAQEYKDAVTTLYPVAYTIKFAIKEQSEVNFGVMPLEGLWWVPDMELFSVEDKDAWYWTAMIMQPELVSRELFEETCQKVKEKKDPPSLDKLRLESYHEGLCVQLMHIGPYADEAPNIARMHQLAFEQGYQLRGKHHEIYLNDPNRTAPEKLKTVIRQPLG